MFAASCSFKRAHDVSVVAIRKQYTVWWEISARPIRFNTQGIALPTKYDVVFIWFVSRTYLRLLDGGTLYVASIDPRDTIYRIDIQRFGLYPSRQLVCGRGCSNHSSTDRINGRYVSTR